MKAIEDPRNVIELDLEREGDLARIAGLCEALGNETAHLGNADDKKGFFGKKKR